jgi:hypothetical protein
VSGSPTYFGDLAYELVSDVDHGRIHATVHIPDRKPPESVLLRLRHPQASALQSVTVDGRPWSRFDPDREVIHLSGLAGRVAVVAAYR